MKHPVSWSRTNCLKETNQCDGSTGKMTETNRTRTGQFDALVLLVVLCTLITLDVSVVLFLASNFTDNDKVLPLVLYFHTSVEK